MDYAVRGKNAYVTNKDLRTGNRLSDSAKKRREYIRSHEFSVSTDPKTNEPVLTVTEK